MDMTTPGYGGSVNVGPQQSYMKTGTTYYSYDGHYFYTNYVTMLSDYRVTQEKILLIQITRIIIIINIFRCVESHRILQMNFLQLLTNMLRAARKCIIKGQRL